MRLLDVKAVVKFSLSSNAAEAANASTDPPPNAPNSSQLIKAFTDPPPPYAILSHRWVTDEEVQSYDAEEETTFQDVMGGKISQKIIECCRVADRECYQWVWIDTCCIDKFDGAERSEAINSMFIWYSRADQLVHTGVTLQELLAPTEVAFLDENWEFIGTKVTLADRISEVTRIPRDVLVDPSNITHYSIAQRMSWAATRMTRLEEDRAYSLMGLFEIRMPIFYGEGKNAFRRLQQEIMMHSPDQSIFAWQQSTINAHGLLAPSPSYFLHSGDIVIGGGGTRDPHFSVTNFGVLMRMPLRQLEEKGVYHAALACKHYTGELVCIQLVHDHDDVYRKESALLHFCPIDSERPFETKTVHIRLEPPLSNILVDIRQSRKSLSCTFDIPLSMLNRHRLAVVGHAPPRRWTTDGKGWHLMVDGTLEVCCGTVILTQNGKGAFAVILGARMASAGSLNGSRVPWMDVIPHVGTRTAGDIQATYYGQRVKPEVDIRKGVSKPIGSTKNIRITAQPDAVAEHTSYSVGIAVVGTGFFDTVRTALGSQRGVL
ncbi:hypothetical protein A0H81_06071 [Grifola frondosa]|uniref:Uncharacterized protein n=1 Tax=Grifola frondosa TaxID=5627 RepID=A0A1C7MAL0_GRIFR|nr:hypothetical protein A0H81_06071 [Grifola frondosa]